MAYIGPEPNPGQNREVDDISSGLNGSEVNFTLQVNSQNVSPGSANAIIVSLGGVIQNPGTDYTVAASTLTFTTAPANGLSFFGLVLGQQIDTEGTADNSITSAMIIDQAVTLAKLPHGTGSTDGKFLRSNNGADPTFETITVPVGIPSGGIILWSGAANAIPSGFVLCNGSNSTPDLRDRFVVGAGNTYSVNDTGGANTASDTANISISISGSGSTGGPSAQQGGANNVGNVPSPNHTHSFSFSGSGSGSDTITVDTRSPYFALCYIMKT